MKRIPSVLQKIILLIVISLAFVYLGWAGIMPVVAVQVLVNTFLAGLALVFLAEILISSPRRQKQ